MLSTMTLTRSESLRMRTDRRDKAIAARFNELCSKSIDGLRPSIDSVLEKLSEEFFLSVKTVEQRLRLKKQKAAQD